jgi:CheY-like chemotaxis protein
VEEKAQQLALTSKYKSEFLANMSHELRTPLNSLLILSKMLAENKDGNLTSEQVKFASTVYSSGNDLLGLINEILDLSKVEAGKMPIYPQETRIEEVSDYIESTFRHVAEQKGLVFESHLDPSLPGVINTDANRLQQVLKNLLSNAFKFTSAGSVRLWVGPALDAVGQPINDMVAFSVQDTGIGIAADKQKLIFEAFQQADGTTSRKYGGTGLGLTISREIARLLGGSIQVRSELGRGSTFTLSLPRSYSGAETILESTPKAPVRSEGASLGPLPAEASFVGVKVLLVDDDIRNIFALNSLLASRGATVLHAENGRLGIEKLHQNPDVDIVLMDTMMPEMDGLAAIQSIRREPRFSDLVIVALTAKAMKGDREKALESGATDYVTKPVEPENLLAVMHTWIIKPRRPALEPAS